MKGLSLRPTGQLLRHALGYAYRGWPVLPIARKGKRPLTKTGLLEASDDPAQIAEWWSRWPNANIGLRTGIAFDALDIDGDTGKESLYAKVGPEVRHSGPISRTGKGEHWLYLPGNTQNKTALLPNVDWRGTNGYIVAPPSVHPLGHLYQWDESHGPDTAIPSAPDWLSEYLTEFVPRGQRQERPVIVIQTNPHQSKNPPKVLAYGMDRVGGSLTDIVEFAESRGWHPRRDGGGRYAIHCPFHEGDNEASMKLYTHDNSFYCFGCGAWGDTFNLRDMRPGGKRAQG